MAIGNVGKRGDAATDGHASDGRATGGCCSAIGRPIPPLATLTEVTKPYDDAKDAAFFAAGAGMVPVRQAAGQFAIFFPDDAHAPCCVCDKPESVTKVVVKVAV